MTRDEIISMARTAGLKWTAEEVPDVHENLVQFAEMVADAEREECAQLCERHAKEPLIMRATKITERPFASSALDCAELIRMRGKSG